MNRASSMDALPEPLASLVREHDYVADIIGDARIAMQEGLRAPLDAERSAAMLKVMRDLELFLASHLTVHIAKEEDVLFPALVRDVRQLIDDMVGQHDHIRERQALLERAMVALEAHDGPIDQEREALTTSLRAATAAPSREVFTALRDDVGRLERTLLGHFVDEEESLFGLAAALLSPEILAELTAQMIALDQRAATSDRGRGG